MSWPKPSPRALLGASCLTGAILLTWGFAVEPAMLRREVYRLSPPGWPAECDGLRIAVLADLHVGSPWNGRGRLARLVERTQAAQPDLILLAGDYVITGVLGGTLVSPEELAPELARLQAPLGVYAVLGNHDHWLDAARVRGALGGVGIPLLDNAARAIGSGGCALWLLGIGDYMEGQPDVQGALASVHGPEPILAFTHNPDVFPDVPARVALTIAGHTHGGQVYIPLIGRPIVPSRYGERYAIGHVVEHGRHLFVASGIGTSILPVRFLVPPEISIVELAAGVQPAPRHGAPERSPGAP